MGTDSVKCPLWGTPASCRGEDYGRVKHYNSPRAGGRFTTESMPEGWAEWQNPTTLIKLSSMIARQNQVGEPLRLNSATLSNAQRMKLLTPSERADRLLEFLALQATHLGEIVQFDFDQVSDAVTGPALAWSECNPTQELLFLLSSLRERGLIECEYKDDVERVALTLSGHGRLFDLAAQSGAFDQVFVAMWFDPSMQAVYEEGVAPAILDAGYRPLRIDRKETIAKIDDEIIAEIRKSRFVVADFTCEPSKPRGGVYFEAGFAMGLNIPVIWMCRSEIIGEVHFDTRQYSHILWSDAGELRRKLYNRIGAVIGQNPRLPV